MMPVYMIFQVIRSLYYMCSIMYVSKHCSVHPSIKKTFKRQRFVLHGFSMPIIIFPSLPLSPLSRYMWADARVLPLKMMQELSRHNPARWSKFKSPGELADELDALDSMRKLD